MTNQISKFQITNSNVSKLIFIVIILGMALFLSIAVHEYRIRSKPLSYHLGSVNPGTPEQHILFGRKIDINTANKSYLTILPGIGPRLAERIVAKRRELGGFSSLMDLGKVRGIGVSKLQKIRHFIDTSPGFFHFENGD